MLDTIKTIMPFPYLAEKIRPSEDADTSVDDTNGVAKGDDGSTGEGNNRSSFQPPLGGKKSHNIKDLRAVYNNLFEPTNTRNVWTSSTLRPGEPDEQLVLDESTMWMHFQCHRDFTKATSGGFQCHAASFFVTNDGDWGLCPPMAQEGDTVVILFGGKVPYVLREREQTQTTATTTAPTQYEFIGECYLQDYMQGLAIQEKNDGVERRRTTVFDLL